MSALRTHVKLLSSLLLVATCGTADGAEFEFSFWPASNAESDPRFVAMHDGPCGQVATARVSAMPAYSKAEPFAPERVFELNARGKVIRRWVIPVDSTPYGLLGNDLLFQFNASLYKVSISRTVSHVERKVPAPAPSELKCVPPKEFLPSEYVRCWLFKDLRSGNKRVLAFEGVCT